MIKRNSIFSIYLLLITIFGGVFHGSFMVYAGHAESMDEGMEISIINCENTSSEQKIENSQKSSNSMMACCEEDNLYIEGAVVIQNEKNEVLSLDQSFFEDDESLALKSAKADLLYKYFSPPEEIILESIVKIE